MLDFKTAFTVAEKIASVAGECIAVRGPVLTWEGHVLPLIEEHYELPKRSASHRAMFCNAIMLNLAEEIEAAGEDFPTELGQTVTSLRLAGLLLLCETQLEFKVREEMRVE